MRPINNYFFIDIQEPNIDYNLLPKGSGIYGEDGNELIVNKDFNKNEFNPQTGYVTHVPDEIRNEIEYDEVVEYINDVPIWPGSKIWFHHGAYIEPHKVVLPDGKVVYKQKYNNIYAVEKGGKLYPTERNIFIRPLFESESDIITKSGIYIKPQPDKLPSLGVVVWASTKCKELGFKEGVKVLYSKNSQYEVTGMEPKTWKTTPDWIYGYFTDDLIFIPVAG